MIGLGAATQPDEAAAAFVTGNQLLSACQSSATIERMDCLGYVSAIADTLGSGGQIQGIKACLPPTVTRGQAQDVVVQWLLNNAAHRHHAAPVLTAAAFAGAFPCAAQPARPQQPRPAPSSTNPFERR
jgi:hypothetical protein